MGSRVAAALVLLLAACAGTPKPQLNDFEALLAANDSATLSLGQWCGRQHFADPPLVSAQPVIGSDRAAPADAPALLATSAAEPLRFRHVALSCGGKVLSLAGNWYVPARLTPAMNAQLESGDTPFGKVAAPLRFRRERLAEQRGAAFGCPAGTILSHRARLVLPDGRPLALVVECYTADNLRK